MPDEQFARQWQYSFFISPIGRYLTAFFILITCIFSISSVALSEDYLWNLSANPYDPELVSNPFGRYGSPFSPDSINNPFGAGSLYRFDSPTNLMERDWGYMGII